MSPAASKQTAQSPHEPEPSAPEQIKRPRYRKASPASGTLTPAHNFAQVRQRDATIRRTREGRKLAKAMLGGANMRELRQKTGYSHRTIQRMLANFRQFEPAVYQEMVDGLRGFLHDLAFADLIYWRSRLLNPPDENSSASPTSKASSRCQQMSLALRGYTTATRTLMTLWGLGRHDPNAAAVSPPPPLTDEELQSIVSQNPEMKAALDNLLAGRPIDSQPPQA